MKELEVKSTKITTRKIKITPCRKCGNTDIIIHNCGYSTFNVGYSKCKKCGFENKVNHIPWDEAGEAQPMDHRL